MMRAFSYISLISTVLLGLSLYFFYNYRFPISNRYPPRQDVYACDFKQKMNEIECVAKGINPFDVWSQTVLLPEFYPNSKLDLWSEQRYKSVNSHPPWEYALLMPFKFLAMRPAWILYSILQVLSFLGIGILAYRVGFSLRGRHWEGAFVAACALMIPYGVSLDFRAGNLCLFVTLASIGMASALNARRDIVAGLLWPIAMLKPQMGLLFAVPIIMGRRITPCLVACMICVLLSIPAVMFCDCSLIEMILQPPKSSSFWFWGCGILPYDFLDSLLRLGCARPQLVTATTICGLLLCTSLTFVINDTKNWFIRFFPATVCSLTCTYANGYNFCLCGVIQIALAICALKCCHRRDFVILIVLCALCSIRIYDLFYFVVEQAYGVLVRNSIWKWGHISECANWSFTTWSSTGLFVLGVLVCLKMSKHIKELNDD